MPAVRTDTELAIQDLEARCAHLELLVSQLQDQKASSQPPILNQQRNFNEVFQPSTERPVLLVYTFDLTVTAVLLTLTSVTVDLVSDDQNPPSIVRATASYGVTANGLSLSLAQTIRQSITYIVPPGHYVNLVTSGVGTAALVTQNEALL